MVTNISKSVFNGFKMCFITILQMSLLIGMSFQINEECLSKNIKRHEINGEDIFPITTFLTDEYNILFQITFEDRMEALDMDYIEIKPESYEIKRKRNGVSSIERFNISIPFGWVNMNLTVSKHIFHFNPYIGNIISEYPMQHLSIASQYLASCKQGTPSWKIVRDKAISVPLNVEGRNQITITSESDFSPFITIMGLKYYLTNESGMTIGTSGKKLSANTYNFIIEHETNNVRLLYKKEECEIQTLVSLKLRSTMLNITFGTLNEDFTLVLEPMVDHTRNCETASEVYSKITESTPQSNDNTGLIIFAVILVLLLMITVTILTLLKINGPKYAPKFHLKIQSDQHEDTEQTGISSHYDIGAGESHKQPKDKHEETEKLLHSLQTKTTETDGQLEAKNREIASLHKSLLAAKAETDKHQQQLQAKTTENSNLQKKAQKNITENQKQENFALKQKTKEIDTGEIYRIMHIMKIKEDPNYCISVKSDISDEFNKEVFGYGKNLSNVLLTIMERFQDNKVVQSAGMQILSNMKDYFTATDKDSEQQIRFSKIVLRAFETDDDEFDVTINSSIILREDLFIEKFCSRVFHAAFRHITLNKDPKVVYECLNLLYHLLTNDNTNQSEDMIDECVETVLKTFGVNHSTDINIISFCILKAIFIEKEKPRFCSKVADTALHYIDSKSNPKLVSECLKLIHNILIKVGNKQKDAMMNKCVESVLKVFENSTTANIINNSCMILTNIISNEKEGVKLLDWGRMAHAAAGHIENMDLEVASDALPFLYHILSKANTDQKKEMVDKHLVEVIKIFLEENLHSVKFGHLHKIGWEILNQVVQNSENNCEIFVAAKGVECIALYLPKCHANMDVTEAVLATSARILEYSDIRKKIIATLELDIFWKELFDCLAAASFWVRTYAAHSICLLGGDDSCKCSVKKDLYNKVFHQLVECIEEKRLELQLGVDTQTLKLWKGLKKPEPKHFKGIRSYLSKTKLKT